ncbi:MAG: hypothetical protein AYP45_10680 [Candidatus Brocadia carolinensis]|uniref:Uncharacterized protein n=1 Tax=Candidatus Brocadia carolinensis TaxID=1004156 RepID=A0A1V4AST6_9BACT|nr:MAG: hypothetical protein AYP45_10680 [Candidatus Brocadia caroliniensis]
MGEKGSQVVMRKSKDRVSAGRTCTKVLEVGHASSFNKHGVARETRHGKVLANAVKTKKNKYLIQKSLDDAKSSVGATNNKSAWDMEQYMRSWLACNHLPAGNFHI